MACKICGGENIIEGVVFGVAERYKDVGPKYKLNGFQYAEEALCDMCGDCGEIFRMYVRPLKSRKWIISDRHDLDFNEIDRKRKAAVLEMNKKAIEKKIEEYTKLLNDDKCHERYVDDLSKYAKHELYEYPIKTKGPSYRLYREIATNKEVMIKKVTMNLDKGNYLVCEFPLNDDEWT